MDISLTRHKKATVIHVSGRLDTNTAPDLENFLAENTVGSEFRLIFDFTDLEYITSAGLRIAVSAQKQTAAFALVCPKDSAVYAVLDMSGMDLMMDIFETLDGAL